MNQIMRYFIKSSMLLGCSAFFFALLFSGYPDTGQAAGTGTTPVEISLTGDSGSTSYGNPVAFTATVTDTSAGNIYPEGTVTFMNGGTALQTVALTPSYPTVATAPSGLPIPSGLKESCYDGPNSFNPTPCPVVVSGGYTFQAYSYDDNRSSFAIVEYDSHKNIIRQWEAPGARYLYQITIDSTARTVSFWGQGGAQVTLSWSSLQAAVSQAQFSSSSLPVGIHSITAVYSGDTNHANAESAIFTQTVNPIATATTLTSNASSAAAGGTVTFTATVISTGGSLPSGTVTLKEGDFVLDTKPLDANGVTPFSISSLSVGVHTITAYYSGDSNHASSVSQSVSQTVSPMDTATVVSGPATQSFYGDTVTLKVIVTAVENYVPNGNAIVKIDGQIQGSAALKPDGTADITLPLLSVGSHSITAAYTGSTNFKSSNSAVYPLNILPHSNANLRELTLSGATLSPAFQSGTVGYQAAVTYDVYSVRVIPALENPYAYAVVAANGQTVDAAVYGTAGVPVALNVGGNPIQVTVTAQDGMTQKSYVINVTRGKSSSIELADLILDGAAFSRSFNSGTTSYTATVANSVDSVALIPKTGNHDETVTVNGKPVISGQSSEPILLHDGINYITVNVIAQDGASFQTYSVAIFRFASGRIDIGQATKGISYRFDIYGDGIFNSLDVRNFLGLLQPSVVLPGS
ncbi:Ig-like domain repeat protein [Paenibacillus piri]|uniref:Cadherin-like beta sandwich domain-containing protein n=1 Tax=Paenibacillus piri TaxID=2547395 RepID=A0A4R5KI34_9BACL|nr:Ig-like domain repeat protein [Paenibacillus piri]TDF94732.1 hypothetical protein E1757_22515 [Paenibacillus piri]